MTLLADAVREVQVALAPGGAGVMLSYEPSVTPGADRDATRRALLDALVAARGGVEFDRLTADEDVLSYLPMAWIGDHLFSYCEALVPAFTLSCPESGDPVTTDLR